MQKFLYAPRAANRKKNEPALFQLSKEDAAPGNPANTEVHVSRSADKGRTTQPQAISTPAYGVTCSPEELLCFCSRLPAASGRNSDTSVTA
jgi:hypothetical protein